MRNNSLALSEESSEQHIPLLALRPKEAARALGIGERLLWSLTNRNVIPHVRLGKAILYPVDELRRYLTERSQRGGRQDG